MIKGKIKIEIDTAEMDKEIYKFEKQLRQFRLVKSNLMSEIDMLDPENKYYDDIKNDLNERLYVMYDKINQIKNLLNDANARKQTIEQEKLTSENIYKILIHFEKLFYVMNDDEKRKLVELLIDEIQVYEE